MMKYKTTNSNLGSQCAAHHESGRTAYIEKKKGKKKEWITRHGPEEADWKTGAAEEMSVCAVRSAMLAAIRKGCLVAQEQQQPWRWWVRGYRIEWA